MSWGVAPVMLKYLTAHIPDGFTTNMVRYPIAAAFYLPLLLNGRRGRLGRFWLAALIPTAVNLVGQTLWAWTPYLLDAGVIAFLLRLAAVWGIVGAFLLFPDERQLARRPIFWIGAALALGGFVAMSWVQISKVAGASLLGVGVMFICSICYGLYGVTVRYVMRDLNPLVVFGVVGTYTSVGLILLGPLGQPSSLLHLPPWPAIILVLSAIVGIALAHGMYYTAVQRIGVAVATLMLCVTPFVTIVGSSIFLGERFTTVQWIGGCVLVLGATLSVQAQQHLPHPPPLDPHDTANE